VGEADGDALGGTVIDGISLGSLLGVLVGDLDGEGVGSMLIEGEADGLWLGF
jgi:hypothetical protein